MLSFDAGIRTCIYRYVPSEKNALLFEGCTDTNKTAHVPCDATHVNFVQRLYPTLKVYQKKKKLATFNLLARAPPTAGGAFATLPLEDDDNDTAAGCAPGGREGETAGLAPSVATIRACAILTLLPLLLRDMWFRVPSSHRCCPQPTREQLVPPQCVEKLDTRTHKSAYDAKTRKEHLLLFPPTVLLRLHIALPPPATSVGKPDVILSTAVVLRFVVVRSSSARSNTQIGVRQTLSETHVHTILNRRFHNSVGPETHFDLPKPNASSCAPS